MPDVLRGLVSKHDPAILVEKLRQGGGPRILRSLLAPSAAGRVGRTWELTQSPRKHWGSLDVIQRRWNLLTGGDASVSLYDYVTDKYLRDRDDCVALSLACGTGAHEVRFARTQRFGRIDGYDLSANRIAKAHERAAGAGVSEVARFHVGDVRALDFDGRPYDVLITINALHHVSPLAPMIGRMKDLLKPGGLVILRDYVGPDRFQWTPAQLAAADAALSTLPQRYRIRWGSGTVKKRNYRPGRLAMMLSDPSEAAESSRILPLLDEMFEPLERKNLGGAMLHLVLKDIAHHFAADDQEAAACLDHLIETEDKLMAAGEVESDFVFGIWRS